MTALDVIENLLNTSVANNELKYCLVDAHKLPHKLDGSLARPNHDEDFINLEEIVNAKDIMDYNGLGISITASKISAIDVDHCFSIPFDFGSIDDRGMDIFNTFKKLAYIEFSFSGKGMRVLFRQEEIQDYSSNYYIKNSKNGIEFYQPSGNARYVTVTGKVLADNSIDSDYDFRETIYMFLDKYMKRPVKKVDTTSLNEDCSIEELKVKLRHLYFKDMLFQELWFKKAPGSGKDESETDYVIISYLYNNVTHNKMQIKELFESSPFFKSKDKKHINKWNFNNFRYFNYVYDCIVGGR